MPPVRVLVVFGSLPSYFPERHGVFDRARQTLAGLARSEDAEITIHDKVLFNADDAAEAVARATALEADLVLLLHGGFTMGDVAQTLAKSLHRVGFWAVEEPTFAGDVQLNNFVSLNMSLSIARREAEPGRAFGWYFGDQVGEPSRLRTTLRALAIVKATAGKKIGRVGGVAPTFFNMAVDAGSLANRWGVAIADYPLSTLRDAAVTLAAADVAAAAAEMRGAASVSTTDRDLDLSARYALAIVDMMDREGLDGIAISDWPEFQEDPGFHPGAAFSWAEHRFGRAVASEGDVLGALSLMAGRAASREAACLLDLCAPNLRFGTMLAWHGGGGPLSLGDGENQRWIDHPMLGRGIPGAPNCGAILDMQFAPGPVTLLRIGEHGASLFAIDAEVASSDEPGFDGVRGWLQSFSQCGERATLADLIETVMLHGLEHHFILVRGHHSDVLAEAATWSGRRWQSVIPSRGFLASPLERGGGT